MRDALLSILMGPFDPSRPPPCCPREDAIYWHIAASNVGKDGEKFVSEDGTPLERMTTFCSDCTMQYRAAMTEQNKCIKSLLENEK